ncbi:MAG TPA: hypothetical protein HA257_04815 [Candidatus Methanoperedenaceae archaeon]|nr:hypothetical protein [Candidatus Methanoperedenaceae archaeon]
MFTPVKMERLFAAVPKDLSGSVIAALGETGACHFIAPAVGALDLSDRKRLLAAVERRLDERLFSLPEGAKVRTGIEISSNADRALSELAWEAMSPALSRARALEIRKALRRLQSIYAVMELFRETAHTYMLEAWVPHGMENVVSEAIDRASGGRAVVSMSAPEFGDAPPTLLSNPVYMRPFEYLVKKYGLPSYYEIDPTCVIFVSFPLIFGMMYGDIGHGIVLLALSMLVYFIEKFWRRTQLSDLGPILVFCAFYSIVFGLLYGEAFGMEIEPQWRRPSDNIAYFLVLSVWIGVAHHVIGFILNAINLWKNKKYLRSIFQFQWIIFSATNILFVISSFDRGYIDTPSLWILVLVPALVMDAEGIYINKIEGKGILSGAMVPFYLGLKYSLNLISYMRLVIMALVHSTVSATIIAVSAETGASLVVSGLVTVVLIIVVDTFVVLVQTLRLHWVEWFYIFYKGRGIEFSPFRLQL